MIKRKRRDSANIRLRSASPRAPRTSRKVSSAAPTPYHPGTKCRFWVQAKTHGIARSSASVRAPNRRVGREPMLSSAISSSGLAAWAHGPAAAVEERDRDAALPPQPRELDLRLRELPVRREEAAVLVRVRVAEHDLVHAALCADAAPDHGHLEQLAHDLRRAPQ